MFYPIPQGLARLAAPAQVIDQTWIARRQATEAGARHSRFAQEYFDQAQQRHRILLRVSMRATTRGMFVGIFL